ncbi:MAG TPA: MerR family transcriptional regulator [Dongiaceae bacterium]|nr:MerR family transcriptional regulator [Dongiaceae bacterium]
MFRIGEFSQIARVSGRLLRYYDSIGLLRPQRIDPETGYRYYSAAQLERLNRILALKDLGLSLDQVARMLDDKISTAEIRGMLALKKAELERSLAEEAARLRHIESRLIQIEQQGTLGDYDVVLKTGAATPVLSTRAVYPDFDEVIAALREIVLAVRTQVAAAARENMVVIAHCDFDDENLDLEIGVTLNRAVNKPVRLPSGAQLALTELPASATLATIVRSGPLYQSHLAFGRLGVWMEANDYAIAGPCREIFLDMPFQLPGDPAVEIQFPVTKAA